MLKKLLVLAVLSSAAGIAADARAGMSYIGFTAGSSKARIDNGGGKWNTGSAMEWSANFGLSLPIPLVPVRAEVEYAQYDVKDIKFTGYGVNAYVGLPLLPVVKPYLGLGISNLDPDKSGLDSKMTTHYMAGLDLDLPMLPVAAGLEYRYIPYGNNGVDVDISSVMLKGRLYF
ncbi:MAG: outer membrane beta-barrel protein [Rickettsiales bacterium]|jgi:opacity protein-like surface antigen|nr:outer membrane beta-barrel protein [Rickettsiales bacterium]